MRILSIIQPSEMGSDFRFDEEAGLWKVNFPAGMGEGGGVPLSTDANNAIGLGTDEGAFISTDLLGAYALTQDNASKKINLYRFPAGTEFNPETATLVSSVNMVELSGIFDDVAIDGDVITFTDADTGLTLSLDTANLQKVSDIVGSDAISVSSIDGETRIDVRIDPNPNNLIQLSEGGLVVDPYDLGGGDLDLHQTLAQVEDGLCHVVGNSHLVVPQIELVDVAGNAIGYINDIIGLPVSSQTHGPDHCPKWEAPTANNCRVGKVAVAFIPDLMYSFNPEDESIEWRVFFNGRDTGYIAAAPTPAVSNQPMLMSLTQEDFGDAADFIGKGYLEEIISNATNGAISGSYEEGVTLLNETNQQVILTLVPNKPISLGSIRNVYNGGEGGNIFGLTLDEITAIRNGDDLEAPPTVEELEDYFDEETGVLSICLAPNGSGNGGSTGPQISCAGATDRFATSGLWYNWTLKVNGVTLVTNGESGQVIEALENSGIRVGYNGETETTYRNMTTENIRIELIAGQPNNSWDKIYLLIDKSTNPTLMGYDPIQHQAEAAMMAMSSIDSMQESEQFQRITVCLAPANDWMNWDYKDIDTSTAEITLTNSVNLVDAVQGVRVEGEPHISIDTDVNKWGDLIWIIRAEEPLRTDVTLTIDHPNYSDEYTCDFFARKPMVVTLANPHEYARETIIVSSLDAESVDIVSVEVVGRTGSTVINNPEDGMLIDAVHGSVRFDDLADGKFSYIVQGRQFATGISDNIKVKFVTNLGVEEVVEHTFRADDIDGFLPIYPNQYSKVTIGLVDNNRYDDVHELPLIQVVSEEWASATMQRVNGVGGEVVMEFDFARQPTYQLQIKAYLNGAELAVLGSCVVGVDDWGDLEAGGYTFNSETYNARFEADDIDFANISKNNLTYVPEESPSNLQNMTGMFAGTDLSGPMVDLSGYEVSNVYSMTGVFARSNFNGNIVSWDTRWVNLMHYAFYGSRFRQDISEWCVLGVTDEPRLFSHRSPLPASFKPVWGTCPIPGSDTTVLRHYVEEGDLSEDAGLGSYTLVASGIKPADVTVSLDGQLITDLYSGLDSSTGMETVVFQVRTTLDSEGLLEIKHPPLRAFKVDNNNYSRPKHVDVVKFGKNVEGFELALPFAFKVPSSIPSTVVRLNRMFEQSNEFADAENVEKWDVGNVLWMENTFYNCANLNADLRNWCTTKILTTPLGFAENSGILPENLPVWGTCPVGSNYIDTTGEPKYHSATAESFITTEPKPLLTGRVTHPSAVLMVYDDNAISYTPAINHGDGTWSCQLNYVKAANQHRLAIEAFHSSTYEHTGGGLMSIVTAEIEGGYWDRATSELVCTSADGVYLRVVNGRHLGFIMSNFEATGGVLKQATFCVTEIERTLADFKLNGPQVGDSRIEPLANSTTHYTGHKGDNNGWTFEPMASDTLRIVNEEYNLIASFDQRGNNYVSHDVVTMNKALFIHLKPVAGEAETRIKLVNIYDA